MKYADQLKTDEWQRKRQRIIKRDKVCQMCNSNNNLHVHHTYYDGRKAWEYEEESLYLLCEDCHEKETSDRKRLKESISGMLKNGIFAGEILHKFDGTEPIDIFL